VGRGGVCGGGGGGGGVGGVASDVNERSTLAAGRTLRWSRTFRCDDQFTSAVSLNKHIVN
jgi:hypothetical protein